MDRPRRFLNSFFELVVDLSVGRRAGPRPVDLPIIVSICYNRNIPDDFEILADILLFAQQAGSTSPEEPMSAPTDSTSSTVDPREVVAERLRSTTKVVGFYGHDPLLTTLATLRRQRHDLDAAMRRLLAYGREFIRPRPYRLTDLADAAGMSISGVRTAYDAEEIAQVAQATGLVPSGGQQPDGRGADSAQ
jgi:hypothetical protein